MRGEDTIETEQSHEIDIDNEIKRPQWNPLFFSSFIFLTNAIIAFYFQLYMYAFSFLGLTLSSLFVHSKDTIVINIIDKLFIFAVFLSGLYVFVSRFDRYKFSHKILIVFTFLFCVWVYIYGFFHANYCFHGDQKTARMYHTCMHLIGSMGHHLICFV